jgi:ubiquinone/menaquinone biosynthesis C-methylase UbiE
MSNSGQEPRPKNHVTDNSTAPATRASQVLAPLDLEAVKTRQQAMWASGDFALIGTTLQLVGESLCEAADLHSGTSVLDVACGNGNATLAAGRRFCHVTGVDYVPALLERGAERAKAERLDIRFVEGDAEELPFVDAAFDVVLSTFGVMFAPDQRQAARELVRVCKRGGKIALASWTREGFIGRLLGVVARYVPPVTGLASPVLWGSESHLTDIFEGRVTTVSATRKDFAFRYESAAHFVHVFRRYYGPTFKAFESLDLAAQNALATDIEELVRTTNRSGDDTVVVPAEYLEIVLRVT